MDFWYQKSFKARLMAAILLPLAWLFGFIAWLRKTLYRVHILKAYRPTIPVIIIGNLSVGGNGKTPVTLWLAELLQKNGLKVGIISRGYGSKSPYYPRIVKIDDPATEVGDEPLLLAKRSGVPVCIGANRQQAIELLQQHYPLDVILSDDGLQHYALARDLEIVVIEARRGLGNGLLMPAGPLRESEKRLQSVDLIINNGGLTPYSQNVMQLIPSCAINVQTGERKSLDDFQHQTAIALAGIGNPRRFFDMLTDMDIILQDTFAFADHQAFDQSLLANLPDDMPVFMTEKDAVKCHPFAKSNWWYVPVEAQITGNILSKIEAWSQKQKNKK